MHARACPLSTCRRRSKLLVEGAQPLPASWQSNRLQRVRLRLCSEEPRSLQNRRGLQLCGTAAQIPAIRLCGRFPFTALHASARVRSACGCVRTRGNSAFVLGRGTNPTFFSWR